MPSTGTAGSGESWLLAQNPQDYTLQLLATPDEKLMRAYLDQHQFTEPVVYFAFQRDGKALSAAADTAAEVQAVIRCGSRVVTNTRQGPWRLNNPRKL